MDGAVKTVEHSIPIDILEDLSTRFLICVPETAKQNNIRICFQIELAHWFYLDFYVKDRLDRRCKSCTMYEFAAHMYSYIPYLKPDRHKLDEILVEWKRYKQTVPTYGAVIFSEDMTHVLLVQSYWSKASWSFPKGKINEEEDPAHCAIREVYEETGFDITNYMDPEEFLETIMNDQLVRLYIVRGVPMDTKFQPRTRGEIKSCQWFAIADLPTSRRDLTPKVKVSAFYMVLPFIRKIKQLWTTSSFREGRTKSTSSEGDSGRSNSEIPIKHISVSCSDIEKKLFEKRVDQHSAGNFKQASRTPGILNVASGSKTGKKNKQDKKSKRQLFAPESIAMGHEFSAPSWANFKFDTAALLKCLP